MTGVNDCVQVHNEFKWENGRILGCQKKGWPDQSEQYVTGSLSCEPSSFKLVLDK